MLVLSFSLKIFFFDIKDKIYKRESGYYGLIIGLVVVIFGNFFGVLIREE